MNYYWVRIYDYQYDDIKRQIEDELKVKENQYAPNKENETFWGKPSFEFEDWMISRDEKGTLLDEYYIFGEELSRDQAKSQVKQKSSVDKFAKPRGGKNGIYAIIMDSDKHWYERFAIEIDTYCFNCGKRIVGKEKDFPKFYPIQYDQRWCTTEESGISEYDENTKYHFCSYDCRRETTGKLRGDEGEWQEREGYDSNGGVYGYIYHIFNRMNGMHYIGQTRYMPFFRWQEHVKNGGKGDICDLTFETICEVRIKSQEYLNNIEAWWIQQFIHNYGKDKVMNISTPKPTIQRLVEQFNNLKH